MHEEEIYRLLPALMKPYAATTFDRAFPYYKDGLNISARRVLFVMFKERYFTDTKKSAKIVGEVIGDLHPHGDRSVYDVLVKMGENFNKNYPFVKPQGNFGNMNGDPPAAMRYTEARLSAFAQDVFDNPSTNKQAIDWQDNYSDDIKEPIYISTKLPIVLLNGFMGIGTGYRCSIPSHSLEDVVAMVKRYVSNKNIPISELMDGIYPEFPTGGIITNPKEVENIYKNDLTGSIKMSAEIELDRDNNSILIHSMPYNLPWSTVIKNIKSLVSEKKNVILSGIRAPVEKKRMIDGEAYMEYELLCSKDANLVEIANELLKKVLSNTYAVELMLNYGRSVNKVTFRDIIEEWFKARTISLNRKYEYELTKLRTEKHINEGIILIYDHMDDIIRIFRTISDPVDVSNTLMEKYGLTKIQAKYIAGTRLSQISNRSKEELRKKIDEIDKSIEENAYLRTHIEDIIIEDAEELLRKYGRNRRTIIDLGEKEETSSIEIMSGAVMASRNQFAVFDINNISNGKTLLNGMKTAKVNGRNIKEIIGCTSISDRLEGLLIVLKDNTAKYLPISDIGFINVWRSNDSLEEIISVIPIYHYETDKVMIFTSDNKLKTIMVNEIKNRYVSIVGSGDIKSIIRVDDFDGEIVLIDSKGRYLSFPSEQSPIVSRTASGVKTGFDDVEHDFILKQIDVGLNTLILSSVNDNQDGFVTPLPINSICIGSRTNKPKEIIKGFTRTVLSLNQLDVYVKMTKCVMIGKTSTVQLRVNNFKQYGIDKPIGHNVLEIVQVPVIE